MQNLKHSQVFQLSATTNMNYTNSFRYVASKMVKMSTMKNVKKHHYTAANQTEHLKIYKWKNNY